jgi:hypothetical protein
VQTVTERALTAAFIPDEGQRRVLGHMIGEAYGVLRG